MAPRELAERLEYGSDESLEQLVNIAVARGYQAVDGEGQTRRVLELSEVDSGSIHRQFFELQPRGGGLSNVFFLIIEGSVNETDFAAFPFRLRKEIRQFRTGLAESKRDQYVPLQVRQEKLSRQMILYESSDSGRSAEFTEKVSFLEKSILYGLYKLPAGPFVFFGKKSQKLLRNDFVSADVRFKELVQKFIGVFRPQMAL